MQLSFELDEPRARRSDPSTSHEAAVSAKELQAQHCRTIVSALKRFGPSGVDRIAALTKLTNYQTSKRMVELERAGLIKLTGEKVQSLAGRAQREWIAVA